MINILVDVLEKVLFHIKLSDYSKAKRDIDGACRKIACLMRELVRQLSDVQLIEMFSKDEETSIAQRYVVGSPMDEDSGMVHIEGSERRFSFALKKL
jgi:hypothetical protein